MDLNQNGKLLCDLRKEKGMTQKQVAEKLGVEPKTISKWETNKGLPDIGILEELALHLGVSLSELLTGTIYENKNKAGNMARGSFYICPVCCSEHERIFPASRLYVDNTEQEFF